MEDHNILDHGLRGERTDAEESDFQLLKLDAANALYHIRNARVVLFVLAAIWGIVAIVVIFTGGEPKNELEATFYITISFTAVFLMLAFAILAWMTPKKPVVCLATGLVLFALLFAINTLQSFSILGFMLGAVVIYLLYRGMTNALKIETIIQKAKSMGAKKAEVFEP